MRLPPAPHAGSGAIEVSPALKLPRTWGQACVEHLALNREPMCGRPRYLSGGVGLCVTRSRTPARPRRIRLHEVAANARAVLPLPKCCGAFGRQKRQRALCRISSYWRKRVRCWQGQRRALSPSHCACEQQNMSCPIRQSVAQVIRTLALQAATRLLSPGRCCAEDSSGAAGFGSCVARMEVETPKELHDRFDTELAQAAAIIGEALADYVE